MNLYGVDLEYKQTLISHYDAKAERRSDEDWEWKKTELDWFIGYLNRYQCQTVLDVGCGTGTEMMKLAETGFQVTGIDLSPEHIKTCESKGLDAKVMDFYQIDFPDKMFDAIFAMSSLLHVPKRNLHIVINEMYRCLKDNQICYIGVFKGFHDGVMPSMDSKYIAMYQTQELIDLIKPAFEVLEERSFRPNRLSRYLSLVVRKNSSGDREVSIS